MRKPLPSLLLVLAALAVCAFAMPEPPDPAWAKEPGWNKVTYKVRQNGVEQDAWFYRRKVEGEAVRYHGGNTTGYTLPLKQHQVQAFEGEGDWKIGFGSAPYGAIEVNLDKGGRASGYRVVLGRMIYFDLNGDGVLDAMYDHSGNERRPLILFEGRYVAVEDHVNGFEGRSKRSADLKTRSVFEGGRWVQSSADDVFPGSGRHANRG